MPQRCQRAGNVRLGASDMQVEPISLRQRHMLDRIESKQHFTEAEDGGHDDFSDYQTRLSAKWYVHPP
ncbi:hypothetical protein [Sphingomonas sp. S2-65]|uniref:hypothetical protein n=1 Tax=Sphingomonas sp. S2-65 TaxID=2903960 RepID=UPI001F168642|nr:hypothetical protein [Sphingomonas sp. S2-65]UYY60379.1 hypothetical protein LZ586_16090 [Sphingomonas sp. S2-65]